MDSEDVNKIDWAKIFMAIAVGVVFIMQQYHAMKLEDVKATVVLSNEIDSRLEFSEKNVMDVLKNVDERLKALEKR